jgi:lysophospholipase L1-like esterase
MRDVRVCVFGDSLVAGVGDSSGLGWVGRVAARSRPSDSRLTVYPLGVRGESTEEIVVRIPLESAARFARGGEHRIVISAGVSDAQRQIPRERSAAALDFGLGSTTVPTLVVGPPPLGDAAQTARIALVDEAFAGVCDRRGIPYISVYDRLLRRPTWRRATSGNGIHPDRTGYAMFSRIVFDGGWSTWLSAAPPGVPDEKRRAR